VSGAAQCPGDDTAFLLQCRCQCQTSAHPFSSRNARPMDVLHLTPWFAEHAYAAGHWKACQAVALSLRELRLRTATRVLGPDESNILPPEIDASVRNVVVEYSWFPRIMAAIRRQYPQIRVHVRAHNAEAWHHLHRSGGALALTRPKALYGVWRLLARDSRCRQLGHTVLSISEWDSQHYWSWLPGGAPILDVPYFSPWPYLRPEVTPRPWAEREPLILCLPGARDAIGHEAAIGFYTLARRLSPLMSGWRFAITEGLVGSPQDGAPPSGVETIKNLVEPWDLLCRAKAVAVLTPLGFGAKTTVFDALAAGCHVLVHPKVAARLPQAARRHCIVADLASRADDLTLATEVSSEPVPNDVNSALRAQAARNLMVAMNSSNSAPQRSSPTSDATTVAGPSSREKGTRQLLP
jgi:hypothetical protein